MTISAIETHLLQSTVFAIVAGLLTLAMRKNRARARYWLWLAASLKFLVPFAPLVALGQRLTASAPAIAVRPEVTFVATQISQPFQEPIARQVVAAAPSLLPGLLLVVWISGSLGIFGYWLTRLWTVRLIARNSRPVRQGRIYGTFSDLAPSARVRLALSKSSLEPGVFGILRPVLLLPEGIVEHLDDAQLRAIFAHELCHVRYRDNLAAAVHMLVETIFWFHPLVWWIGSRLVEERERACDEEVVGLGTEPEAYAAGILKICRYYLASPLPCAAGISGSDLRRRVESIMTAPVRDRLGAGKKAILAVGGALALLLPIGAGVLTVPAVRVFAQTPSAGTPQAAPPVAPAARPAEAAPPVKAKAASTPRLEFEVASVKVVHMTPMEAIQANRMNWHIDDAQINLQSAQLLSLITYAFGVPETQLLNAGEWMRGALFDVSAKLPSGATKEQAPAMLQALLADRFKLVVHHQEEIRPVYELVAGKFALGPSTSPKPDPVDQCKVEAGHRACKAMTMSELASMLTALAQRAAIVGSFGAMQEWNLDRPVIDQTHLEGAYDFTLDYGRIAPPSGRGNGEAPLYNLRDSVEALGLRLQAAKRPFDVISIDHIEKAPTEN